MADGSARLGVGLDFGLKRQDVFDLVSLLCACSVGGAYPWSGQCNELIIARGNVKDYHHCVFAFRCAGKHCLCLQDELDGMNSSITIWKERIFKTLSM